MKTVSKIFSQIILALTIVLLITGCSSGSGSSGSASGPDTPSELSVKQSRTANISIEVSWIGNANDGSYTVALSKSDSYTGEASIKQEMALSPATIINLSSLSYGGYYVFVIPVNPDGSEGDAVIANDGAPVILGIAPPDDVNPVDSNDDGDFTDPEDDLDGDGITNQNDNDDSDGDGVSDVDETICGTDPNDPNSKPADNSTPADGDYTDPEDDFDGDGIINSIDQDDDNDGVSDADETATGSDPFDNDSDNDGIIDGNDPDLDSDGDGINNSEDTDSDNDGVNDTVEIECGSNPFDVNSTPVDANSDGDYTDPEDDCDGDGIINANDTDSDNDGVSDADEIACGTDPYDATSTPVDANGDGDYTDPEDDIDGNGITNANDIDSDGDGICDAVETALGSNPNDASSTPADNNNDGDYTDAGDDQDGDGIINSVDNDSDNDGVTNAQEEASGTDANSANTQPEDNSTPADGDFTDPEDDFDGDGIANGIDDDDDNDGVSDGVETTNGSNPFDATQTPTDNNGDGDFTDPSDDFDGDGLINSADPDDDNDGYNDTDEIVASTDPFDATETPVDTDNDGIADVTDLDDDNDGSSDIEEITHGSDPLDADSTPSDSDNDGDGIADINDPDDDNDGISDVVEDQHGSNPEDAESFPSSSDNDGDGQNNDADSDDDNDGFTDQQEAEHGTDPFNANSNPVDNSNPADGDYTDPEDDFDGDGIVNGIDDDDDNDGVSDAVETAHGSDPFDATQTPNDADNDGLFTEDNDDFDGDGLINSEDPDDDNDGITDIVEIANGSNPFDPSETPIDADGDGSYTGANDDFDGDGVINSIDTDDDGDGVSDAIETTSGTNPYNPGSKPIDNSVPADGDYTDDEDDLNGDGEINGDDEDNDGDGFTDNAEITAGSDINNANSTPDDIDGDGIANADDTDANGNGIADMADIPGNVTATSSVSGQIAVNWDGNINDGSYTVEIFYNAAGSGDPVASQSNVTSPLTFNGATSGNYYVFVTPVDKDGVKGTAVIANSGSAVNVVNVSIDITQAVAALTAGDVGYGPGDSEVYVTQNLSLPLSGLNDTTITWTGDIDNYVVISNAIGSVNRPQNGNGNQTIQLTATISKGGESETKNITLTIIEMPLEVIGELIKPGVGAIEVLLDKIIEVPFAVDLNSSTINDSTVTLTTADGTAVNSTITYEDVSRAADRDGDGTNDVTIEGIITIVPQILTTNTSYTVSITSGVEKSNGTALLESVTFSFTTIDVTSMGYYYNFESLDGFTYNGVSLDTNNFHEGGSSFYFDGDQDYLILDDVTFEEDFSVAIWVYLTNDNNSGSSIDTILSNTVSQEYQDGFKLFFNTYSFNGSNKDRRVIFEAGNGTIGGKLQTRKNFIDYEGWYHFVITVDRDMTAQTADIKLYFNGVAEENLEFFVNDTTNDQGDANNATAIPYDFNTSNDIYVGQFPGSTSVWDRHNYCGNMDDLRIYKRVLTPSEAARIAQEN